jgi:polysaccharide biosynthesis transport protein
MDGSKKTVIVSSHSETMDVLAGASRFARSLRARKGVLLSFLLVAGILGAAYYVTADRVYQSEAEIMVLQTGGSLLDPNTGQPQSLEGIMPTYERSVSCDRVIKETIKLLPREHLADFKGVRQDAWIEAFRSRLTVTSPRATNNIRVAYRSSDPETAFVVVGNLLTAYLNFTDGYYRENATKSLEVLQKERSDRARELQQKQDRKLQLIAASPVLLGAGENMTNIKKESVVSLNSELVEAQKRRLVAHSQLQAVEKAIMSGGDIQQLAMQMSEAIGTELLKKHLGVGSFDTYTMARLQEEIYDHYAELQELQDYYGEQHFKVRDLKKKIELKEMLFREQPRMTKEAASQMAAEELGPRLLSMARQQHEIALANEAALRQQYEQEGREAASYNEQLAHIKMLDDEIKQLQNTIAEISSSIANTDLGQQNGLRTQITSDPRINRAPVSPKLSLVVLISFILGFTGGGATIYVLDLIDDRFHSADDLKSQVGVPILTSIQKLKPIGEYGLPALYTYARPNAPESEAFRTLRTSLDFTAGGVRRLTISSTQPSDGKTTVISNLAVAYAQAGRRVIVIDGDMRRPGLTRLFQRSGHAGLSSVLKDERPIVDAIAGLIFETELPNLHVLPAGPKPINPVELLTSERLSDLLAWAETNYDQVLIDAPPSLAVTDAAIIGRLVDGAILTVCPDLNRRKAVLGAAEALTSLGCELQGIVLNRIEAGQSGYGYGHGYGYGYGQDVPVAEEDETATQATAPRTPIRRRRQAA